MQISKLILKPIITLDEFLDLYDGSFSSDYKNILNLDFELDLNRDNQRICPIIHLAKPTDAEVITQIFKDVYEGTYPYKQMEDVQEIKNMIMDSNYHWFLFKVNSNEVVGCFAAHMEFEKKRGLLYGFAIKRKYQKIINILKAFIGCILYAWKVNKDKILVWYADVRTYDSIPQLLTSLCGLKPIAFFPNKDVFFNNIESDFMHIIYDKNALDKYRDKKKPKIIRQALGCYNYSNSRFHLGSPKVENPRISFDELKMKKIERNLYKKIDEDRFGFKAMILLYKNSDSYFKFIYNPYTKSIEKTKYKVKNLEELHVFIKQIKKLIENSDVRYFECFVSSFEPLHQKIFFKAGFKPRGYIFSWDYKKNKNTFEDNIVFNYYKGNINNNLKIIPEASKLLKVLNFDAYTKTNFFKG